MRPFLILFIAAVLMVGTAQAQCSNGRCAPVAKSVLVKSTKTVSKTVVRTRSVIRAKRVRLIRRWR